MKNMKNIKSIVFLLIIGFVGITSCTKMDDFKMYTEGGEISYTGRIDSLKIRSGRNRVQVQGLFISDRKITLCKIYWNSRQDSLIVPVKRTQAVDELNEYITGLFEGNYNFEIITYDAKGNPSIPVVRSGVKVYGDNYAASLVNMPLSDVSLDGSTATITWGGLDKTSGAVYMDILYTNTAGAEARAKRLTNSATAELLNYKYRTTFDYRTVYLPDSLAIDTFYTDYRLGINARTDVTASFIDNPGKMDPKSTTGTQFYPVSMTEGANINSTNWRKLAAWTSNDQANNWGSGYGTYGTFVQRTAETITNFGTLSMEAGKNTINSTLNKVTNGKVYQTKLLPAGEYTLEARVGNVSGTTPVYFVANVGTSIPDIANLTSKATMLSLTAANHASYMQITTSAQGYNIAINFTLPVDTQVSFGFVGTLTGTTTTNQYLKISGVRMKSLAF